jgi:SAM-dependent methyltransferase
VDHAYEDVNRRYFVHYAKSVVPAGARVLDYGCGEANLVKMLDEAGFDAYGCDIRWPGADYKWSGLANADHLVYFEPGGRLPFDDDFFDLVISDQVFEHVEPIEESIPEIERVVKPDGIMYHHFPAKEVWREGHIGIPFSHRLPDTKARLAYTTAARRMGAGKFKNDKPPADWAAEKLKWVDEWTVYRDADELHRLFGANATVTHREIDYCRFRAGDREPLKRLLASKPLTPPSQWLFRRLAFMAIECRPRPTVASDAPVQAAA